MPRIKNLLRNFSNMPGWHTDKKIVVIESDDWGSVRMPSKAAFDRLKKAGVDLESNDYARYNHNDTLANSKDLEFLFEVLNNTRDKNGNPCVFTAICVMANPDFLKIKKGGFSEYYYEKFTETLKRYYPNENVFGLWETGIKMNLFIPQFHGREHLNVEAWMKALNTGHKNTVESFNEGLWGFVPDKSSGLLVENQAAFQLTSKTDLEKHRLILIDGLKLFEDIFGYKAKYFVPPNGPINNDLNRVLIESCIKYRSTSKIQLESIDLGKTRRVLNWLGKRDKSGIRYITRNCFFEPSQHSRDWVDSCLNDIKIAFSWKKPAIISSHRVNYIGVLNPSNRDSSLKQLKTLLNAITKEYPDVEFLTSVQLGDLMSDL